MAVTPNKVQSTLAIRFKTVMDLIVGKNIFKSTGGDLVARDSAQIVERIVEEYDVK